VIVRRPRARKDGREVELPAWSQFADEDPMDERTMEQMVLGVSTRNYKRSLEELPDELGAHGDSKSAASRRFVAATQENLDAWLKRTLSELKLAVAMIDGIEVAEHVVIVALGIDENGQKHLLGLWQGATENATVCEALLNDLVARGLDAQQSYLRSSRRQRSPRPDGRLAGSIGVLPNAPRCLESGREGAPRVACLARQLQSRRRCRS